FLKRIPHGHVTYGMGKGFDELIIDRFDDDQAFGGITSLSYITKTTFDCPLYGLFDIGIGCNDKGIRATKLQYDFFKCTASYFCHCLSSALRTRQRHTLYAAVLDDGRRLLVGRKHIVIDALW